MKKFVLLLVSVFLIQGASFAKDILQFDFPDKGWHQVESPDKSKYKKCYVPYNQTAQNYTEMLIFYERIVKTPGITAMTLLQKQLGKDKLNYTDIYPEYIKQDFDNSMAIWCSQKHSICTVQRAFQGKKGVVIATYINKMPHYSQNIMTNKVNILGSVKVYDETTKDNATNLIQL
ncbi:hypothetical protein IJD44_05225 [bacterium]|nr:hypothetical protein [bacterium]